MTSFPPPPPWVEEILTVGVTGTNGKSSTVGWIAAALNQIDDATVSVTTLGHRIGPQTYPFPPTYAGFLEAMGRGRDQGAHHAAIELTSASLAAGFLRGWRCRVGVFTNLSQDHLDIHGSAEHYLASKAQLFLQLPPGGSAVLNCDDPASELLDEIIGPDVERWRYGRGNDSTADLVARDLHVDWNGTVARLEHNQRLTALPPSLRLSAIGDIYVENALAALLGALAAGVPADRAAAAIEAAPPPAGRFEVVSRDPPVVVDYAHTPDALRRTLATARHLCPGCLTVVTGAGGNREQSKRAPLGRAAAAADRIILTSDNARSEDPAAIAAELAAPLNDHPAVTTMLDRRSAIAQALADTGADDLVVVAGKGHETEQIDGHGSQPLSDAAVVRELLGLA